MARPGEPAGHSARLHARHATGGTSEREAARPARELSEVAVTSAGLLLAAAACVVAFALDLNGPLRTVLALGFLLFVPGLAVAELLPVRGPAQRLAIATAASLGLETLVAVTLIYADLYSTGLALAIVVSVTVTALAVALVRAVRTTGAHAGDRTAA